MSKVIWKDLRKNVKYYTNVVFVDSPYGDRFLKRDYKPTFTLAPEDHDGYYSMEKLFLDHYQDPTEYSFVRDVFEGDLDHWEAIKECLTIRNEYPIWKKRAMARLTSEAMCKIVETAFDSSNKNSFTALKYLVEKDAKPAKKAGAGRPKKPVEVDEVPTSDLLADIARLKE